MLVGSMGVEPISLHRCTSAVFQPSTLTALGLCSSPLKQTQVCRAVFKFMLSPCRGHLASIAPPLHLLTSEDSECLILADVFRV